MTTGRPNTPETFWERVERRGPEDCWPWEGYIKPSRYGLTSYQGKTWSTHRLAYTLAIGSIPEGLYVLHRCDNPSCCNPAHLFLGTQVDNMEDMYEKERNRHSKGEAHVQAKLTEENVREIRRLHKLGATQVSLAKKFGVGQPAIKHVLSGRTWSHVD